MCSACWRRVYNNDNGATTGWSSCASATESESEVPVSDVVQRDDNSTQLFGCIRNKTSDSLQRIRPEQSGRLAGCSPRRPTTEDK